MTQSSELLLVDQDDAVAVITLNRPEARNALSRALLGRLRAVLNEVDEDDTIAVVILTGADPAFCAGLDLKELSANDGATLGGNDDLPLGSPWQPLSKPLIGAVNGVAVTGGFELALNCDFLIASDRASFADTHARVGILPGWGLSVILPQRIGFGMAKRMSFTGDFLGAAEALQAGLVTEVVPHDQLMTKAKELARSIAANNGPAVAAYLESYRRIEAEAAGDGLRLEAASSTEWLRTGGAKGIADRVPGVFDRGRDQLAHGGAVD